MYDATGLLLSFGPAGSFIPSSTGEEPSDTESDGRASLEEEQAQKPGKGPSRNARRKKHKRQLRRLGLLATKTVGNPGSQMVQQRPPAPPQQPLAAVSERDEGKMEAKRRKIEPDTGR